MHQEGELLYESYKVSFRDHSHVHKIHYFQIFLDDGNCKDVGLVK